MHVWIGLLVSGLLVAAVRIWAIQHHWATGVKPLSDAVLRAGLILQIVLLIGAFSVKYAYTLKTDVRSTSVRKNGRPVAAVVQIRRFGDQTEKEKK